MDEIVEVFTEEVRKRVCCNCGNDIRVKDDNGMVIRNECAAGGHFISYAACFEGWCRRWRKEKR